MAYRWLLRSLQPAPGLSRKVPALSRAAGNGFEAFGMSLMTIAAAVSEGVCEWIPWWYECLSVVTSCSRPVPRSVGKMVRRMGVLVDDRRPSPPIMTMTLVTAALISSDDFVNVAHWSM